MAEVAALLRSDRAAGQSILSADFLNVDGDFDAVVSLPAGFGDCLILNAQVQINTIATMAASFDNRGVHWQILDSAADLARDFLGSSPWYIKGAAELTSFIDADQLVVWRETEQLHLEWAEVDTNVTPTGDAVVLIRVRRLRQTAPPISDMDTDRLGRIVLTL